MSGCGEQWWGEGDGEEDGWGPSLCLVGRHQQSRMGPKTDPCGTPQGLGSFVS